MTNTPSTTPTTAGASITAAGPDKAISTTRPLLVNVAQAAATLCVSRSSIYQLIWTDELVPIRIGRSVRFSLDQLEQFVAERMLDRQE
ncbi:helix-turn-helix domain-containing protein [Ilumatobacter sp.]|jgi:excisionase family DNA binding protein|uniref:helix-turn-helix domain-containing protein n=1 Tax=Ilumatobacter sp. TaxID=1967498 RepID=UPI0037538626